MLDLGGYGGVGRGVGLLGLASQIRALDPGSRYHYIQGVSTRNLMERTHLEPLVKPLCRPCMAAKCHACAKADVSQNTCKKVLSCSMFAVDLLKSSEARLK